MLFEHSVFGNKKTIDSLNIFKGHIELESELPEDFKCISTIDSNLPISSADRYEMALLKTKYGICFLVADNQNAYALYKQINRICEDHDFKITDVYFANSNVLQTIYKGMYSQANKQKDNKSLSSFKDIINDAISMNADNINIFSIPGKYARITFEVYKQITPYRTVPADDFYRFVKAYYTAIDDSMKNPKEFSPEDYCDGTTEHVIKSEHEAEETKLFNIRWHSCSAIDGGYDVTIRINQIKASAQSLPKLGYDMPSQLVFDKLSKFEEGFIVMSGSTGSGKTTTMASFGKLYMDNSKQKNKLLTIEDPNEIPIPNSHPSSVFGSHASGSDKDKIWAKRIESAMRRAPHGVYVSEIRNADVANSCLRLALSGHLTMSTIHAHDPFQALNLLRSQYNVDLSTLLMPKVLRAIISQKLVPTLCPDCSINIEDVQDGISDSRIKLIRDTFGYDYSHLRFEKIGAACGTCNGLGRIGLQPIYEMFLPSQEVANHCLKGNFTDARNQWLDSTKNDGVTGITAKMRAIDLCNKKLLCTNWALDKVILE